MQSTSDTLHGNAQARANGDAAEPLSSPPVEPSSSDATIRFQAQLLNMVEQAVIATDLTGRITFWNRFAETLYGWTAEEVLGRDVLAITVAPAAQVEANHLMTQQRRGESWSGEFLVRRRNGATFTAHVTNSPIMDKQGNLIGIVGLSSDVTERQRAHSILHSVVEGTSDGVFVKDAEGRYVLVNAAGATNFGLQPAEMIGKDAAQLYAPEHAERFRANDLRVMESGQVETFEETLSLPHGTRIFQTVKAPYRDAQGNFLGTIGVSRDITEQKQAEDAHRFLSAASALLAESTDYETRLTTIAQLAVPQMADWCVVHTLQADGSIEQMVLVHAEPTKLQQAHEWLQHHPPSYEALGLAEVLRNGKAKLVTAVPAELWAPTIDARQGRIPAAARITSYMIVPLIARERTLGTVTFLSAESHRRYDAHSLTLAQTFANQAAIFLDNARLYRESQQLNAELEQRVGERTAELVEAIAAWKQSEEIIQTLFRVSKKLNATLDLETIMDELARDAIQIVNAESGFAGLRTEGGMTVRKYFHEGTAIPFEYTWPAGHGMPGWVLRHKVSYGTSDAANDPVILRDLPINANVRSAICTPILDGAGEVIAYFDIRNKKNDSGFTAVDHDILMALSPVASIAIQNAVAYQQLTWAEAELKRSYGQLRALAANLQSVREAERTQIARELHDELGQALTALKFDLAWLTSRLAKKKDISLSEKAKAITTQIDTTIKTVRRISTDLRPGMLDDLGLVAAIEWQCRAFQKRTGIDCVVSAPPQELPLTREQSTALFRIFQETLTNVARHAGATRVNVTLDVDHRGLTLEVQDNGRGIGTSEVVGTRSLGLLGMRERAELLGGAFQIRGVPGAGTTVRVWLPLTPEHHWNGTKG